MRTIQIKATAEQFKRINAYIKEIGAEVVKTPAPRKASKKKTDDPVFLDNRKQLKELKNELRRKYNEKAKTKIEYIL